LTYSSANASMTRRQPSSDIAATYFTSGEKTKSRARVEETGISWYVWKTLTHNALASYSPMAYRILGHPGIFVRLSGDVDSTTSSDWMPRGHSNEYVVSGIPVAL
jgi:hypothetical protein